MTVAALKEGIRSWFYDYSNGVFCLSHVAHGTICKICMSKFHGVGTSNWCLLRIGQKWFNQGTSCLMIPVLIFYITVERSHWLIKFMSRALQFLLISMYVRPEISRYSDQFLFIYL